MSPNILKIRFLVKILRAVIFIVSVDDHHKINFIN